LQVDEPDRDREQDWLQDRERLHDSN
jgi:hypothetical protein